jgi:hypothetical protein
MRCTLTIVRYPQYLGWAGFISMALFRLPLWLNQKNSFYKLMGCGKNGTFDKTPDWRQWALLEVFSPTTSQTPEKKVTPKIIQFYWKIFNCEKLIILLQPIESHGKWDNKFCFGELPKQTDYEGTIAVLTRATIRLNKLSAFWQNVDGVASQMATANGFVTSFGIGEIPWIKQATFSVWQSKQSMKTFAYSTLQHKDVIQKTKKENWYSEEMFTRFTIISCTGKLNGKNPLEIIP